MTSKQLASLDVHGRKNAGPRIMVIVPAAVDMVPVGFVPKLWPLCWVLRLGSSSLHDWWSELTGPFNWDSGTPSRD